MNSVIQFWMSGGPILWVLFLLAITIYFPLCTLASNVRRVLPTTGNPKTQIIIQSSRFEPPQRHLAKALQSAACDRNLRLEVAANIGRQLRHLNVLIHLAPLIGLFGTVNGIYHTFRALADRTSSITDLMSSGISEALITTATGLLIAIPAVFLLQMTRQHLALWVNSPAPFPELAVTGPVKNQGK